VPVPLAAEVPLHWSEKHVEPGGQAQGPLPFPLGPLSLQNVDNRMRESCRDSALCLSRRPGAHAGSWHTDRHKAPSPLPSAPCPYSFPSFPFSVVNVHQETSSFFTNFVCSNSTLRPQPRAQRPGSLAKKQIRSGWRRTNCTNRGQNTQTMTGQASPEG